MNQKFVKLTYEILQIENLTSTDKIVLAYNRGYERYYASNEHAAKSLGMTASSAKKSIIKLRKLGLWHEKVSHPSIQVKDTRVTKRATGVTNQDTLVSNKKLFSPLKPDSLLDSRLENNKKEELDSRLGNNKKEELDSAAVAEKPDIFEDALLKNKISHNTTGSVSKISHNTTGSVSNSKAKPFLDPRNTIVPEVEQYGSPKWKVPLGADGRPITRTKMGEANFLADQKGEAHPYSASQIKAGREPDVDDMMADFLGFGESSKTETARVYPLENNL